MFQTTVKQAVKVPGLEYLHVTGIKSKGNARVGDTISDGETNYTITAIPLIHRNVTPAHSDEVDICVSPNGIDADVLIGKTLYAV